LGASHNRIQCARVRANIPQAKLAKEAGISTPTLSRLENGKTVQLDSFQRVLKALSLFGNFNTLLPSTDFTPIEMLKIQEKVMGERRKRASRTKKNSLCEKEQIHLGRKENLVSGR